MAGSSIDYTYLIKQHTDSFIGREWLFAEVDEWLMDPAASRFFLLTGEPGSGKTAVAARLVQFSQDKVDPPRGLDHFSSGFLSAIHFCSVRDRRWISPHTFAESLALQLSHRYPTYAKALAEKSGDRQITIKVSQQTGEVSGKMAGVVINLLDVGSISAEDAFIRVVREPLEVLFRENSAAHVIILIDALDESLLYSGTVGIVSLLAQAESLPARVRFIVTSRPETKVLRPLRRSEPEPKEFSLTPEERSTNSLDDVQEYVQHMLSKHPKLVDRLSSDFPPETFAAVVRDKSRGNFLYVTYLLQMLLDQLDPVNQASLNELPDGLDGIYIESIDRTIGDRWETYGPVLGTLAVAQAALTDGQLASFVRKSKSQIRPLLKSVRQFLATDESVPASRRTYAIYHRSFADFVLDEDRAEDYWCDASEQHERIIAHYWGRTAAWEDLDWASVDDYGLLHLSVHLYALKERDAYRQKLYGLICKPLMREKRTRYGSHQPFAADVELAIATARTSEPPDLVQEVRGSLIYAMISTLAANVPPETLEAMAWVGRAAQALGFAALKQDWKSRSQAYRLIGEALLKQEQQEHAKQVFVKALTAAENIRDEGDRAHALHQVARTLGQTGSVDELSRALVAAEAIKDNHYRVYALSGVAQALVQADAQEIAADVAGRALAATEAIEPGQERAEVLIGVAQALAKAGDFDEALATVERIQSQQESATALAHIVQALSEAGEFGRAIKAAREIQDDRHRAEALSQLAIALDQVDDQDHQAQVWAEAETIWDRLWQAFVAGVASELLTQEEVPYTLRLILEVAREHLGKQLDANTVRKAGQSLVQTVGERVVAAAANLWGEESRAYSLIRIAQALARSGEFGQALAVAEIFLDERSRAYVIRRAAPGLTTTGLLHMTAEVADRAPAAIVEVLDERDKVVAWTRIMQSMTQTLEPDQWRATATMIWDGWHATCALVLQRAAQTLARVGEYDYALMAIEAIQDQQERAIARSKVAQVLAQTNAREQAIELADQAFATAKEMSDAQSKAVVLSSVACALDWAGVPEKASQAIDQALETTELAVNETYRVSALSEMAQILGQTGAQERAIEVANQALTAAATVRDVLERSRVLSEVAQALIQADSPERAVEVANQALAAAGAIPDTRQRIKALSRVAYTLARAGKTEQALIVTEALREDQHRLPALCQVAHALAQAGAHTRAVEVAEQVLSMTTPDVWEKPRVLSDAAGILIQSGAQKRGVEVAIQAQVAAMSISDAWHKVAALSDVIKALIQTGSQTQAREMAHQALAVVTREQPPALVPLKQVERNLTQIGRFGRSLAARAALLGNKRETQMLDRAVWSLTLAGGSSQALAVAEEIRERWHKAEALGRVAEVLALLGEQDGLKRALAAAEPIWDAQHRVYALCVVARALAKAGSQERAVSVTDKALAATEYIQDENVRIDALSRVARTLALIEPPSQALLVWSKGLVEAKAAGLHSVFSILKEGAALIAAIDNGQKLWSIYETVIEVEEWW